MITIKKDSTLRRLLTVYGCYHPWRLNQITDICSLSKAVMFSLTSVFFIIVVTTIIFAVIIWPAFAWVFLLLMGFSLNNPGVVTSLFTFTVCAIAGFSFIAYVQYKLWQERREQNPRPPTIMQEWMASIKGKYCARVNFEE